jgi:cytochrome c peroxidase
MGTTVDEVVEVLKRDATLERRFDEVFGGQGIGATADRLGLALAAFLSSLEPPNTPYHEFVGGREAALTAEEKAGLAVFRTRGRCDACHCGPGFTDGLVHAAQPANGIRLERTRRNAFAQMRELARTQRAAMLQAVPQEAPGRSRPAPGTRAPTSGAQGYGGVTSSPMVQTLSLWDVARTAPYFRDGSVTDLSAAVRTHIAELQAVRDRNASRRLPNDQRVRQMMVTGDFMAATLPESLRAQWPDGLPAAPEALDKADVSSLVAFLKTLSPRAD